MKATSTTEATSVKAATTVEPAAATMEAPAPTVKAASAPMEAPAPTVKAASAPTVAASATSLSTGAHGQSQRHQQNYIEFAHKHPRLKPSTREANVQTRHDS